MSKSAVIVLFGGLLAVVMLGLLAGSLFVVERLVAVDQVSGHARYWRQSNPQRKPVAEGTLLSVGDTLETDRDGLVGLRWADGTRIKVGPDTTLVLRHSRADTLRKTEQTRVRLNWGQVWLRVRRIIRAGSKFEVETPTVVAAVRGTVFSVAVDRQGNTRISVLEGKVSLDGAEGSVLVGDHTGALVAGGHVDRSGFTEAELAAWSRQEGVTGPLLTLDQPPLSQTSSPDPYLELAGRTEPGCQVTVSGKLAMVDRKGAFSARVPLVEGENELRISSRDADGRETVTQRTVSFASPAAAAALTGSPGTLPPDGRSTAAVTATVQDAQGRPVPDGTPVAFSTTGGSITELARTAGGTATATFTAGTSPGELTVTAASGRARAGLTLSVRPDAPAPPSPPTAPSPPEQHQESAAPPPNQETAAPASPAPAPTAGQ